MQDFIQKTEYINIMLSQCCYSKQGGMFFRFLFFFSLFCFVFLGFPCVFLLILDIFLSFCKIVLWLVAFSSLFFFLFLAVRCFNLLQSLFRTGGVPASACFRVPPPDNVLLHSLLENKVLLLLHIRWRAAWKESLLFVVVVDEVDGAGSCGRQRQPSKNPGEGALPCLQMHRCQHDVFFFGTCCCSGLWVFSGPVSSKWCAVVGKKMFFLLLWMLLEGGLQRFLVVH